MKRLLAGLSGLILATSVAFGGAVTAPTGPLEPSQLQSIINQLVTSINNGVNGLLANFVYQSGTPLGTAPANLYTYTLPASTLSATGQGVRVTCFGDFAANTNTKTVAVAFGVSGSASVLEISGTTQGASASGAQWRIMFNVVRAGATSSLMNGFVSIGPGPLSPTATGGISTFVSSNATVSYASDTAFTCWGINGTSASNDVRAQGMIVEQVK